MNGTADPTIPNFNQNAQKNPTDTSIVQEKEMGNCFKCNKKTPIKCRKCQRFICSKHAKYINRAFYCEIHFVEEKRQGILKISVLLSVMLIGAVIVLLTL